MKDLFWLKDFQFKEGQHPSLETEFKKGQVPWNKGKKLGKNLTHSKIMKEKYSNPLYRKMTSERTKEAMKLVPKEKLAFMKGKKHSKETKRKMSEQRKLEKHWNWQNGKSFEEYDITFNKELRNMIRKKYNYICQRCGIEEKNINSWYSKLDIHHKDSNKKNNYIDNLIPLCRSCHIKVHHGGVF